MLDLKQLRSFRAVAEHGSFSAAAGELGYTQPAISQHIAALESHLGAPLVRRLPRSIQLTDAGATLLAHADSVLCRIETAEAEIQAMVRVEGGRVRLASIPTAGASLVPAASAAFRAAHPGVEIKLSITCVSDGAALIEAGQADIALLVESELERSRPESRVERVHLLDDPFYLVLPASHALADRPEVELADLAAETWIIDDSPCPDGAIVRRACERAGFEPIIAFENDDYSAVQGFISAGGGIALIPTLALQSLRSDLVVRRIAGGSPIRRVIATVPRPEQRSAVCEAMLAALVEVAEGFAENLPASELAAAAAAA